MWHRQFPCIYNYWCFVSGLSWLGLYPESMVWEAPQESSKLDMNRTKISVIENVVMTVRYTLNSFTMGFLPDQYDDTHRNIRFIIEACLSLDWDLLLFYKQIYSIECLLGYEFCISNRHCRDWVIYKFLWWNESW